MEHTVWIIIPAYHEAKTIGAVVRSIRRSGEYRIVVVDDGSTDATSRVALRAGAHVLVHVVNRGQGAALATGTAYALAHAAEYLVHFDADGQHAAETINVLLEPLFKGKAEVALGSRFLDNSTNLPPLKKWLILKPAILFTRLFSGMKVTDTHNGLRALTLHAAGRMVLAHDRMAHASEILDEISAKHISYTEVPVTVTYHTRGQGFLQGCAIIKDLFLHKLFYP